LPEEAELTGNLNSVQQRQNEHCRLQTAPKISSDMMQV